MRNIKRIILAGWKGIGVWSILISLGIPSMLRSIFHNLFNSWTWYDQVVLLIGIFLLVLGVLAWITRSKDIRKQEQVEQPEKVLLQSEALTRQDQALLDSHKRQFSYDKYHLKDLLVVRNERLLRWKLDPVMGGRIDFAFDVFNGSVLSVKVGYSVEGNLKFRGRPFHDTTEPLTSLLIPHGGWGEIVIKQRVLPEVVKEIRDEASKPSGFILLFDFQNVHIGIEEDGVTQGVSLQTLNIVKTMEFRVKHEADIYSWQRLFETSIS